MNSKFKAREQKKRFSGLYLLFRANAKWLMVYDVIVSLFALKMVEFCYTVDMLYYFSLVEYFGFSVFILMAGNIAGIYERNVFNGYVKLFSSLLVAVILGLIGFVLLRNIFLYKQIGRYVLLFIFVITFFSCGLIRLILGLYIRRFALRVLFVGNEEQALIFKRLFRSDRGGYDFVGYCNDYSSQHVLKLGEIDDVDKICDRWQVDLVIIDDDHIVQPKIFDKCLEVLKLNCAIIDKETFVEQSFEQVIVDELDPLWFYRANLGAPDNFYWILKRSIDICFSVSGLIFTMILFPIIWLAIKLDSSGPVFYSQIRCGRFDREFKIYKFRTMEVDAEKSGAVWAKKNDNRITRVGSILRKMRFDELPQFWNILVGDMSFVGPRPERPELVKKIEEQVPYFYFRNLVKPGVTGFAQIKYRYGASIEDAKEKLKYDLYYVKNWSLLMDFQIILRTIVMLMKGSR